jgi:hypothetical protein
MVMERCTITGSERWHQGSVDLVDSRASVRDSTITRTLGGIVLDSSDLEMSGCHINENTSSSGGGLRCTKSTVALEACKLEGNWGDQGGGLAILDSTATLTGCSISGNGSQVGGGIHCQTGGKAVLLGCSVLGNGAEVEGGGAFVDATSSLVLTNCQVIANRANRGAAASCPGGDVKLMNCTISGNQADVNGVIWTSSPSVLTNGIVWGNAGAPLSGDIAADHSCIQGTAAGEGNIDQDPLFLSPGKFDFSRNKVLEIANYRVVPDFILDAGDYRLGPMSPAIDAGTPEGAPPTDIVGIGRPCGRGVDMGANEYCGPRFRRGDVNSDDRINITDILVILYSLFRTDAGRPTCDKTADIDDSGLLDISDPIALLGYEFLGGPAPAPPVSACGFDPTSDDLGCDSSPACP